MSIVIVTKKYIISLYVVIWIVFIIFANMAIDMQMKRINRLKIVLAEQGKTGKWLAHALGKNESTVSRWCTNEVQPSVETLLMIAETLKIDIKELLCSTQMCNQDGGIQI